MPKTKNIDINRQDKYGVTALMWASRQGQKKIAEILYPHNKSDIYQQNKSGDTR